MPSNPISRADYIYVASLIEDECFSETEGDPLPRLQNGNINHAVLRGSAIRRAAVRQILVDSQQSSSLLSTRSNSENSGRVSFLTLDVSMPIGNQSAGSSFRPPSPVVGPLPTIRESGSLTARPLDRSQQPGSSRPQQASADVGQNSQASLQLPSRPVEPDLGDDGNPVARLQREISQLETRLERLLARPLFPAPPVADVSVFIGSLSIVEALVERKLELRRLGG